MYLANKSLKELKAICKKMGIRGYSTKKMDELIESIDSQEKITAAKALTVRPPVLELCKIPYSVNIEQLKEHLNRYFQSRIPYYREKNRALYFEDEFAEFYLAKSTGGTEIGGGSCAMDVKTKDNEGIDAMCVVMASNESNEKSLMQNFSESGENLDKLFKDGNDVEAVNLFTSGYSNKLLAVKQEKGLNDLYILAFVSTLTDVYLVCFKINMDNIKNLSSGGFLSKSTVNIIINNFIDTSYGNVKLYKSKKRMELRLSPNVIKNEHVVKLYTMPQQAME